MDPRIEPAGRFKKSRRCGGRYVDRSHTSYCPSSPSGRFSPAPRTPSSRWRARRSPNDRRFELTDMSVAFLRSEAPTELKITFAGHVSAFGWRPESDPKLEVIVRTRGGASIYFWNFAVSVRCADSNRPLPPLCPHVARHTLSDRCCPTMSC